MRLETWLHQAKKQIDGLDAELIATRIVGGAEADRSFLVSHNEQELTLSEEQKLNEWLERRWTGEPLAYIMGEKEFCGRKFKVTPAVLIPRPETETLVDMVESLELVDGARILEVGTGSGCVAITLALDLPRVKVVASDVSEDALKIARENNRRFEKKVKFVRSDLLEKFRGDEFEVVVANLPYVDRDWGWLDCATLDFEPEIALYSDKGGLEIYERFLEQVRDFIKVKYVVIEADPCQHETLTRMAQRRGLKKIAEKGFGLVFCKRELNGW